MAGRRQSEAADSKLASRKREDNAALFWPCAAPQPYLTVSLSLSFSLPLPLCHRYYMERKIFQHLLELKSLQIRSNKLNESVLVKRAVDDYHKSCVLLGGETGTRLRRYTFTEYTFKNFELFLYETLKGLQKPGNNNFQNINEVYEEVGTKREQYICHITFTTSSTSLSLSLSF